jgi:hypothetical protein
VNVRPWRFHPIFLHGNEQFPRTVAPMVFCILWYGGTFIAKQVFLPPLEIDDLFRREQIVQNPPRGLLDRHQRVGQCLVVAIVQYCDHRAVWCRVAGARDRAILLLVAFYLSSDCVARAGSSSAADAILCCIAVRTLLRMAMDCSWRDDVHQRTDRTAA